VSGPRYELPPPDVIVGRAVIAEALRVVPSFQGTLYEVFDRMLDELDRVNQLPFCLCPATSEYDPPCPRHGVVGFGWVGR
jgi:hypothetical protein